jgi:carboxyl-terminal processing protease
MSFRRSYILTLSIVLLCTIAFLSGYFIRDRISADSNFPVLMQAYRILKAHGLTPIPSPPTIEYGMIRGMLQSYNDPYTIFVPPAQHELESNTLQGNFGGIGARLSSDNQGNILLYPLPGSPALKAGVKDGDRLVKVDDLEITPQISMETIQAAIRGPVNQKVNLTVASPPDYLTRQVSIQRAEFRLPSTTWNLAPDQPHLGVLVINIIAASSPTELQTAIKDLQKRGATHFVLDLRDNPGGLLNSGVEVAKLFLKDGIVIEQRNRDQDLETYRVEQAGPFINVPLAVLVNHNSASAAEIIAGALQSHKRAIIIGTPTFGKNTIQLVFDLKDGASLHVTAAQWSIPGLPNFSSGVGLQPDILLDTSDRNTIPDRALQTAIQHFFPPP